MGNTPFISPHVVELTPLFICVALVALYIWWTPIKAFLRGLRPKRRRVVRGRVRRGAREQHVSSEPSDLPVRPASLARRRDLRPKPRTAPAAKIKASPASAVEAGPADPEPTRAAVAALRESIPWPLDQASLTRLPILHDGQRWHCLDATASRHAVICGASRSGKGNLLQVLALTVLAQGPERALVWVLDPKGGLDYQALRFLAHARVYADVVAGAKNHFDGNLATGYRAAIEELGRRNDLLLSVGARNHHEYREYRARIKQPSPELPPLPILVLICDEVAQVKGEALADLETLARMAAAAGIVVWAATQYPTAERLPSQVQANALDRIVFKFPSPRYTAVALGLAPGERAKWEPSALGQAGIAILRQDGADVCVGRAHHLTDKTARAIQDALRSRYPRPPLRQEAVATVATPHQDAVVATATEVATGSATVAATASEAPISAEIAPVEEVRVEASSATETEKERKKAVAVKLAAEGKSQDQIRQALVEEFGSAVGQASLVGWWREGKAQAAQESDGNGRPAETAAEPVRDSAGGSGQADISGTSMSKLAAAA